MGAAIQMYGAKSNEAKQLYKIVQALGDEFLQLPVTSITGKYLRDLG